jgi:hypothetical protein
MLRPSKLVNLLDLGGRLEGVGHFTVYCAREDGQNGLNQHKEIDSQSERTEEVGLLEDDADGQKCRSLASQV